MWSKPSKGIQAARSHIHPKALLVGHPISQCRASTNTIEPSSPVDSLGMHALIRLPCAAPHGHEDVQDGSRTRSVWTGHEYRAHPLTDPARWSIVLRRNDAIECSEHFITPPLLKGTLSSFNSVIGVVLVSRMVLNLRGVAAEAREDSQASWGNLRTTAQPQSRDNPGMELSSISPLSVARSTPAKKAPFPGQDERADVKDFGPVLDISRARIIEITNLRNVSLV
ncbi:hypothetical protein HWV62_12636 [Athelia sp. TMB]|nr:hypothetical protein HWV62_12636 [Athelia sp. TMB]